MTLKNYIAHKCCGQEPSKKILNIKYLLPFLPQRCDIVFFFDDVNKHNQTLFLPTEWLGVRCLLHCARLLSKFVCLSTMAPRHHWSLAQTLINNNWPRTFPFAWMALSNVALSVVTQQSDWKVYAKSWSIKVYHLLTATAIFRAEEKALAKRMSL